MTRLLHRVIQNIYLHYDQTTLFPLNSATNRFIFLKYIGKGFNMVRLQKT
jgi:hypothetical protein